MPYRNLRCCRSPRTSLKGFIDNLQNKQLRITKGSFKKYVHFERGGRGYPKSVWKCTRGGRDVKAKCMYAIKKLLIVMVIWALILAWLNEFLISWYPVWQAAQIFGLQIYDLQVNISGWLVSDGRLRNEAGNEVFQIVWKQ